MSRWGEKYSEFIKILGMIGIGIGFSGMIFIVGYVIMGFIKLFTIPDAPATFALIVPGINIPGSPIMLPLVHGLLALFIVVVIHEFGHGLVSRAYKIPVLSSGIVFFGPLIGAFVEPDEKKTEKQSDVVKYSIFAAGPFANMLTAVVVIGLLLLVFFPMTNSMVTNTGFSFTSLDPGMPAELAGMTPEAQYTYVNGMNVTEASQLLIAFENVSVNQTIQIGNSTHLFNVTTTESPNEPGKAYIGVLGLKNTNEVKEGIVEWVYYLLEWVQTLLVWIFQLSLGLGAANLLPLGPVDGGRMIQLALKRIFGDKKGHVIWVKSGQFLLVVILILLFTPMIRAIF